MNFKFAPKGVYEVVIRRKTGEIESFTFDNLVTYEGEDYMLQAAITGETASITTWFIGLIGANITPTKDDTASSTIGAAGSYGEITSYDEANRPAYSATYDAATHTVSNGASVATFTINSTCTVYGAFITSTSGKNDGTGKLLSAGMFGTSKDLSAGDTISIAYTIQAA